MDVSRHAGRPPSGAGLHAARERAPDGEVPMAARCAARRGRYEEAGRADRLGLQPVVDWPAEKGPGCALAAEAEQPGRVAQDLRAQRGGIRAPEVELRIRAR